VDERPSADAYRDGDGGESPDTSGLWSATTSALKRLDVHAGPVPVTRVALFAAYPVAITVLQQSHNLHFPGLMLAFGLVATTYYAGAVAGALFAIESLVLFGLFVHPYTVSFSWQTVVAGALFSLAFVLWTDRVVRAARKSLQRSRLAEERFDRIFEGTQVGVIVIDPQTRLVEDVNPTFCRISGYARDEIVGRPPMFMMQEHASPVLETPEMPKLLSGELASVYRSAVMKRPDGEQVFVDIVAVIVTGEDGAPRLAGTIIDRTAHMLAEEQVRRSQKLDAVGRLAGGIAHDFNNLLTVISGYAALALEEDLPPSAADDVDAIRQAASRASQLTRQLLAFSRKVVLRPQPVDLNAVIVDLGVMLRRLIEAPIRVQTKLAPDLAPVHADEAQVEQVLMNLILNARDAMPTGGTMTIATWPVTFDDDDRRRRILEIPPGEYVGVSISDTGQGMSPEAVEHIFEPFYTTKGENGTGLGLATVYGIVQQSGGAVDVESRTGEGTTMTVYLPIAPAGLPDDEEDDDDGAPTPRMRGARILLVEDERAVRELAQTILVKEGHDVVAVDNPDRALELVADGLELDLLLTDIVMPARSGIELAAEVERQAPGISVVYMSGYSEDVHGDMPAGAAIFVAKPFDAQVLLESIDAALVHRAGEATNV
jgi:two-component system cell cycle sensor histidine kinase/response regulator CckA